MPKIKRGVEKRKSVRAKKPKWLIRKNDRGEMYCGGKEVFL